MRSHVFIITLLIGVTCLAPAISFAQTAPATVNMYKSHRGLVAKLYALSQNTAGDAQGETGDQQYANYLKHTSLNMYNVFSYDPTSGSCNYQRYNYGNETTIGYMDYSLTPYGSSVYWAWVNLPKLKDTANCDQKGDAISAKCNYQNMLYYANQQLGYYAPINALNDLASFIRDLPDDPINPATGNMNAVALNVDTGQCSFVTPAAGYTADQKYQAFLAQYPSIPIMGVDVPLCSTKDATAAMLGAVSTSLNNDFQVTITSIREEYDRVYSLYKPDLIQAFMTLRGKYASSPAAIQSWITNGNCKIKNSDGSCSSFPAFDPTFQRDGSMACN